MYMISISENNDHFLGVYTFTHTVRRPKIKGQRVELRKQIGGRTYQVSSVIDFQISLLCSVTKFKNMISQSFSLIFHADAVESER